MGSEANPRDVIRTRVYLRGVNGAKFRRQVVPGDSLRLEISLSRRRGAVAFVQFFVLDRKYALSGAQPPEVFRQALTQAWEEKQQHSQ